MELKENDRAACSIEGYDIGTVSRSGPGQRKAPVRIRYPFCFSSSANILLRVFPTPLMGS